MSWKNWPHFPKSSIILNGVLTRLLGTWVLDHKKTWILLWRIHLRYHDGSSAGISKCQLSLLESCSCFRNSAWIAIRSSYLRNYERKPKCYRGMGNSDMHSTPRNVQGCDDKCFPFFAFFAADLPSFPSHQVKLWTNDFLALHFPLASDWCKSEKKTIIHYSQRKKKDPMATTPSSSLLGRSMRPLLLPTHHFRR